MRVIFSTHAKVRLRHRAITISSVRRALKKPTVRKPSYPPTEIVQSIDKNGTLEVVFKKQHDTVVVITAYYL